MTTAKKEQEIKGRSAIKDALGRLCVPGHVYELRIPHTKRGTIAGYFNDLDKLADAAARHSGEAPGIYITVNPVNPALLARSYNRVVEYAKYATTDKDILRRNWFLVDIDATRPAGISSSEEEHNAAIKKARESRAWLKELGWPEPILADNGNGAHLLFRVDLPNDDATRDMFKKALEALAVKFTDDAVAVDPTSYNGSRIWKLYGTLVCKGENLPERPHRVAQILEAPAQISLVSRDRLEQLAAMAPGPKRAEAGTNGKRPQGGRGDYSSLDIVGWFQAHGLYGRALEGGKHAVKCPWADQHSDDRAATAGDTVIWEAEAGKWPSFHCSHSHCHDRKIADIMALWPDADSYCSRDFAGAGPTAGVAGAENTKRSAAAEGALGAPTQISSQEMKPLAGILDAIVTHVRQYMVLTPAQLDTNALWVAHTHVFDAFDTTPYINLRSAEKRSGKTRLMEVDEDLIANPLMTSNISVAALVHEVEGGATLLLDEVDTVFRRGQLSESQEALPGILDTGYRRKGYYTRMVGQGANMKSRRFKTFGPKMLAGIGKLPGTLEDRSVVFKLKRKAPTEKVEKFFMRTASEQAAPLAAALAQWASSAVERLREARPNIPDALDDRASDSWRPLFAIAEEAGGDWPQRATAAALELSGSKARQDDSLGVQLLRDIKEAFETKKLDKLFSSELLDHLNGLEESPWGEFKEGKGMTSRDLARRLKEYEAGPLQVRRGEKSQKGYDKEWFDDLFSRYCPPLSDPLSETSETLGTTQASELSETFGQKSENVSDNSQAQPKANVSLVSDKAPGKGQEKHDRVEVE